MGNSTINEGNSYENEILSIIKKNNWSKKIHLIGHQSDMSNFYSAINCMVMASKSETFGMVTLESLAYEVPVIGSNAGGTPELLGNGEFGYLFESQNAKSLAKNILKAYRNKKDLSKSKLNKHLAKFDHHFICEKIENELSLKNWIGFKMNIYSNKQKWKIILFIGALALIGFSLFISNSIVTKV